MKNPEYENLLYRRQFLLTGKKIDGLSNWKRYSVCRGTKVLHVHPDLDVVELNEDGRNMIFMGYIYDWQNPEHGNERILQEILKNQGFQNIVESTYEYSGRFVILYEDIEGCSIFHDAGAQREVHYTVDEDGVSCASQLPIMKQFINIEDTEDKEALKLYRSKDFLRSKKQWPGEFTIYKNVKCLRPNHYLDMTTGEVFRYWPVKPLKRITLEEASDTVALMLNGFVKACSNRKKLIVPVTAGWDSRLLLAATRDIREEVKYFVIRFPHMSERHVDITIPKRLMKKLGCRFDVININGGVDSEFERIFKGNTAYPREDNLVGIYGVFYKMFSDRMNISSHLSEVVRSYAGKMESPTGKDVSKYIGYENSNAYVIRTCEEWINKNAQTSRDMGIDLLTLFDWEESNWEASHRTETDIALEEYCPLSCRKLLETMVSVRPEYRNKYECILYNEIMKILWPQVLSEPVNPSLKRNLEGILVSKNLMYPLKKIKNSVCSVGRALKINKK